MLTSEVQLPMHTRCMLSALLFITLSFVDCSAELCVHLWCEAAGAGGAWAASRYTHYKDLALGPSFLRMCAKRLELEALTFHRPLEAPWYA